MKPVIDLSKEYGIALEGGGAKGAYQIGAWKALREAGVKIRAVAGTSVGALNGALICMGDLEKAEQVWESLKYSSVMDVDDTLMEQIFDETAQLSQVLAESLRMLGEGGADITPLRNLLKEHVDEEKIRSSPIDFYACTFSLSDFQGVDVNMKQVEEGQMQDMLLASAYFPVFKNEKIGGKTYVDGGVANNVPVSVLLEHGLRDIIVIRIFGIGHSRRAELPEDGTILQIAPRVNLGGILEFDGKKSRRNMKIGYYDALRAIYGLKGTIYYIEQTREECYYLKQLLTCRKEVMEAVLAVYGFYGPEELFFRKLLELVFPVFASELKLGREWSYTELYLAMLEATAKLLRVQKYKVYTPESLRAAILKKAEQGEPEEGLPAFAWMILERIPEAEELSD